jgi:hypothetical protein
MFFTGALLMIFAAKVGAFFLAMAILCTGGAIAALITWIVNSYKSRDDGEEAGDLHFDFAKSARKVFIWLIIFGILGIFVTTFTPSTREFLILATFKGVDQYNATHPNSLISVNGIVGTADDVMKIFQDSLMKVENLLEPPKTTTDDKK